MKVKIVVFVLLAALVLTGCAPAVANLTKLPDEASVLLFTLLTAGVTWLLLKVSVVLKIDLSGYTAAIVAIIGPILVTLIEGWLQLIPPAFDNLVLTVIHFLVLLLGSIGVFVIGRRKTGATVRGN